MAFHFLLYCEQPNVSKMRDPKPPPSSMETVNFSNETPKCLRVLRFKRRLLVVKIWEVKQAAVVISNSGLCTNTCALHDLLVARDLSSVLMAESCRNMGVFLGYLPAKVWVKFE